MNYTKEEILLEVKDVSLNLGGTDILKNVNVCIKDIKRPGVTTGQIISLLAPSGIGKTQLFEIMAGLKQPNSGSVQIFEEGLGLKNVKSGKVGVVQQKYPLYNYLTVEDNLKLSIRMKKGGIFKSVSKEDEEKIKEYVELFNLQEHIKKFPILLSGGQRQRVAIAQQLLCSEHFLLMDEPFSGLDVLMIKKVSDTIRKVANLHDKNTIIIVSHDIASTVALSDTIWLMGRERDQSGNIIPGAKILEEIDLIERGLMWKENIESTPEFLAVINEIKNKFTLL